MTRISSARGRGLVLFLIVVFSGMAVSRAASAQKPPQPGEEMIQFLSSRFGLAPTKAAPDRAEGEGPFDRLIVRGATLIDGTGAPPIGPMDIVIEGDRIARILSVGHPHVPIDPDRRPQAGDHEIDAAGMYVMPGFVDAHAHIATPFHGTMGEVPPAEYVYKLWMAHGVTTIRELGSLNGLGWTMNQRDRSAKDEITAPRILSYAYFPTTSRLNVIETPEQARAWIDAVSKRGADGVKFFGAPPAIMKTAIEEAKRDGLRTACHHAQLAVTRVNVLDTSGWGLDSMEHWYGLPEALLEDRTIQDYPPDYNYNDEQDRFRYAGRLWKEAARPGSDKWESVMTTLLERGFTIVPTFTIYEANRDLMRARRAEWHDQYTWPTLTRWFAPSRKAHGSYWFSWSTRDEIEWRNNYRLWMTFINEYKNRGGRVAAGSDAGFIYKLFGFAYIRELELLQEAGFSPLEVIRAATLSGAELLGVSDKVGSVEVGKKADLVIVAENPLANFKVLYGTGALHLNDETGAVERIGGVRWTVKDGVVYDAGKLRDDVRQMVAQKKTMETKRPTRRRLRPPRGSRRPR
ncbi:MAG: amidohydrolase family protein [Acidobacteriota bacterium]